MHLGGVAGVAVEQEAVDDVAFLQTCAHHVVGDRVGNQVAGVDVRLRFLAQLGLFLDVLTEDITGGNRGNLQRFSDLDGHEMMQKPQEEEAEEVKKAEKSSANAPAEKPAQTEKKTVAEQNPQKSDSDKA